MNGDGTDVSRVTNLPEEIEIDWEWYWPTAIWSPDGTRIAFAGWDEDSVAHIYMTNADSSSAAIPFTSPQWEFRWIQGLAWSPDGGEIGFYSFARPFENFVDGGVFRIDVETGDITVLREDDREFGVLYNSFVMDWSPDSSQILFASHTHIGPVIDDLFFLRSDGSEINQVTFTNSSSELCGEWSPDGTQILFCGDDGIYTMNPDGSEVTLILDDPNAKLPAWSRDGTKIAFASDTDGDDEIYVMNADGSDVVQITRNEVLDIQPQWQP